MRWMLIGLVTGSLLVAPTSSGTAVTVVAPASSGVTTAAVVLVPASPGAVAVARVLVPASPGAAAMARAGASAAPRADGAAAARMGAAAGDRAIAAGRPSPAPAGEFGWPLPGFPAVLRPFIAPSQPYGPGHRGVDLGGVAGSPVLAAGSGVVVFAGPVAGRPVISIDHADGLRTTYEPVEASVRVGEAVARGSEIGRLQAGHEGCTAAACLHWGVRRGDEYLDPLRLLTPGRVRLLPFDG